MELNKEELVEKLKKNRFPEIEALIITDIVEELEKKNQSLKYISKVIYNNFPDSEDLLGDFYKAMVFLESKEIINMNESGDYEFTKGALELSLQ